MGAITLATAPAYAFEITLTFDEALDGGSVPANGTFVVDGASGAVTVTNVELAGAVATITLTGTIASPDTLQLTYNQPLADPMQDAAENPVATFQNLARRIVHRGPVPNREWQLLENTRLGCRQPVAITLRWFLFRSRRHRKVL